MSAAIQLRAEVGTAQACDALGIPRATFYRKLKPPVAPPGRPAPPLALSDVKRHPDLRNKATPIFTHLAPCQCQGIQLVGLHLLDLRDIQVHADEVFPARCLNPMGSCRPCPKVGPPAAVCYDSTPTRRIGQRWGATRAPTWASDGGAGPFGVLPFA